MRLGSAAMVSASKPLLWKWPNHVWVASVRRVQNWLCLWSASVGTAVITSCCSQLAILCLVSNRAFSRQSLKSGCGPKAWSASVLFNPGLKTSATVASSGVTWKPCRCKVWKQWLIKPRRGIYAKCWYSLCRVQRNFKQQGQVTPSMRCFSCAPMPCASLLCVANPCGVVKALLQKQRNSLAVSSSFPSKWSKVACSLSARKKLCM